MLASANPEVGDRVAALVRRIMDQRAIVRPVGPDEDLRTCGLSSLQIVTLMLSVEMEFAVKIPEREMIPANFRSIARIAGLVGALLRQPAA